MTDTRKKDFITRLAVKNLKGKLDIIKDKSPRERISELYKMIHSLNSDQINALKTDLKKFTPELTALQTANRVVREPDHIRELNMDDEMIQFALVVIGIPYSIYQKQN
jgi:hypothetical protein